MRDILSRITKWWEAGESFGLATVVRTYRSAPRDPGAALAVIVLRRPRGHRQRVRRMRGGRRLRAVAGRLPDRTSGPADLRGERRRRVRGRADLRRDHRHLRRAGRSGKFPRAGRDRRGGRARRAGRGRDGDRRTGPDRRAPGDLGPGQRQAAETGPTATAGIPVRPAPWARRGWTRRSTTTSAACWPRG